MGGTSTNKTRPLKTLALAAENTAPPAVTTLGSNMTWSGDWSGIGVQLADDEVKLQFIDKTTDIDIDEEQSNRVAQFVEKKHLKSLTFGIDENGLAALSLDSCAVVDGNTVTFGTTITRTAMCIEYRGLGFLYIPSARIAITEFGPGSKKKKGGTKAKVTVKYTSSFPYGFKFYENS